jgi:hypothetical protein
MPYGTIALGKERLMEIQNTRLPFYLRTLTGLLAVVLIAVAALTTASAQTPAPMQAKIAARPVTRGDIAAYKLPSTTQTSGGLNTVGLGQPLYLEAQINAAIPAADVAGVIWKLTSKPATSKADLVDGPLGPDVPVYEPSERLTTRVAGHKMLRPDTPGAYVVSATITAGSSGTSTVAQTFIAGEYVGRTACAVCHSGGLADVKATTWAKTAHANLFKEGVEGVASDHYSGSCISCHTVGYDTDPAAVNNGFDDVAKKYNWVFPAVQDQKKGVYDAMPDALKEFATIGCENCHGPGSQHIKSGGNRVEISVSYDSGTCAQCHDAPTHHIKNGEWNNSMHAVVTEDPSGAGRESCVGCHTGTGFIDKVKGVTPPDTTYRPVNCQTCHEPHGQTSPDTAAHLVRQESVTLADGTKITTAGTGGLCMNCHQSRVNGPTYAATSAASSRFGPHHGPQADMLMGTNGYEYGKTIPSSAHGFVVPDTCATCHMPAVAETDPAFTHAGGHTFKPAWNGDDKTGRIELVASCQQCHGPDVTTFNFPLFDYDGDGEIDGVQTEVQHLLDQLSAMLPPLGKPKTALTIDSTWTRPQLEAGFNWQMVANDGSLGIHNMAYTVGLLKASINDLKKAK